MMEKQQLQQQKMMEDFGRFMGFYQWRECRRKCTAGRGGDAATECASARPAAFAAKDAPAHVVTSTKLAPKIAKLLTKAARRSSKTS